MPPAVLSTCWRHTAFSEGRVMAISLKDQLLKAGLADAKKARQADHARRQAGDVVRRYQAFLDKQ